MNQLWPGFLEAVIAAIASGFCFGLVYIIKLLARMQRALDHLGPSVETIYMMYPFILRTLGHQNDALKEAGANGSTDLANKCIDAAETILRERHASLEGKLSSCREA